MQTLRFWKKELDEAESVDLLAELLTDALVDETTAATSCGYSFFSRNPVAYNGTMRYPVFYKI